MIQPEQITQSVTLLIVVLIINTLERRSPGFPVNRNHDLALNLFALMVVIFFGEQSKKIVLFLFNIVAKEKILPLRSLTTLPGIIKLILAVIFTDFSLYWVHRAMHQKTLWPTHSFHHSIPELWWLSGSRTSCTHLLLFAIPQIFIGYYILSLSVGQIGAAFSFGVIINIWIHANLWVNLGRVEEIFITPNYHRIHHGAQGLTAKNMGFVFTCWDRMFGTYANPQTTGKEFSLLPVPTKNRLLRMIAGI
ncbi:MAG: sterol desaturase family protein [Endomicrobiales bacterium]|jgi:sterol desaturase/sphingolipid hydroxylase (fatty acid hydroxylase superfamily)